MAETEQDVLALLACMNMSPGASRAFEVDPANMLGALNQFICNGMMPTEIVLCMPGGTSRTVRIWIEDWEIVYSEPTEHPLKTICSARGWRYKDLADAINKAASTVGDNQMATNRHTVCRWFTKDVAPTPHTQRILADVLGVPRSSVATNPWPKWLPVFGRMSAYSIRGRLTAQRVHCVVPMREGRAVGGRVYITHILQ